jgi:hypothetical protein
MLKNNHNLAGQPAAKKLFSCDYRYALFPVHTRFDDCEWFITDAYSLDTITGKAGVIYQGKAADAQERFDALKTKEVE